MNRFLQDLHMAAGHWATTACPLINDRLSYKMLDERRQQKCAAFAEYALPLMADRLFMEKAFTGARYAGAKQLVMVHTGYDTFDVRNSLWYDGIQVFDINPADVCSDKQHRLVQAGEKLYSNIHYMDCDDVLAIPELLGHSSFFDEKKTAFVYIGDLPVRIGRKSFEQFMEQMFKTFPAGSSIVFSSKTQGEEGYSYTQLEKMLSDKGFHIYEYLSARQMYNEYIRDFEILNSRQFTLPQDISYCVAVKKIK